MFIDLFVAQIDLRTVGDDERKLHPLRTRALALQEHSFDPRENQFANRTAVRSSLRFQLPVERGWNVNGGADGILLHKFHYGRCAINMEDLV